MGNWIPDHRYDCSVRDDDDRGFIGFEDNGDVLVSPVAHAPPHHMLLRSKHFEGFDPAWRRVTW